MELETLRKSVICYNSNLSITKNLSYRYVTLPLKTAHISQFMKKKKKITYAEKTTSSC